jgi:hypothetical protein
MGSPHHRIRVILLDPSLSTCWPFRSARSWSPSCRKRGVARSPFKRAELRSGPTATNQSPPEIPV